MREKYPKSNKLKQDLARMFCFKTSKPKKLRKNVSPCCAMFIGMANHVVSYVAFRDLRSNDLCFQIHVDCSSLCRLVMTA